jgi:NADH-quinone oxidoreductase subunit E
MSCVDPSMTDRILERYPPAAPSLIQVLQDVHRAYNYLPCGVLTRVAEALNVPLAKVFSVATFYRAFSLTQQGDTVIRVCLGTACHIRGAGQLVEELERQLGVGPDQTTEDLRFTIKTVNCVGACAMAPVLIVGEKYWGNAKPVRVSTYLAGGDAEHES